MTAPETRWTAETAAMLRRELGLFLIQEGALSRFEEFAEHILEALAEAGLLLPVGGVVLEETSWSHKDGTDCINEDCPDRRQESRGVIEWPDGTVLSGPWIEVPS